MNITKWWNVCVAKSHQADIRTISIKIKKRDLCMRFLYLLKKSVMENFIFLCRYRHYSFGYPCSQSLLLLKRQSPAHQTIYFLKALFVFYYKKWKLIFYMFSNKVRRSIGYFFLPLWLLRWLQSYEQNCEFRRIVFIQYHNTDYAFFLARQK